MSKNVRRVRGFGAYNEGRFGKRAPIPKGLLDPNPISSKMDKDSLTPPNRNPSTTSFNMPDTNTLKPHNLNPVDLMLTSISTVFYRR